MNVETVVESELRAVAKSVEVPFPPNARDLAGRARRDRARAVRRRGAVVVLAAAALIAAAVMGSELARPDASPSPAQRTLRTGQPPQIPFVLGDRLYLYDAPVPGTWWSVQTAGNATVALRADDAIGQPVLFLDTERTQVLDRAVGTAVLSPDGRRLAWLRGGRHAALVVYDVAARAELGRLAVDPATVVSERGDQIRLLSVGEDGTVTYTGRSTVRTWRPGTTPTRVSLPPDGELRPQGFPADSFDVRLTADGNWGAWLTDRRGRTDLGSPGRRDGVTFQAPGVPRSRFTLALPAYADARDLAWESAQDVLVTVAEGPGVPRTRIVRCTVEQPRHCEYAATPGTP